MNALAPQIRALVGTGKLSIKSVIHCGNPRWKVDVREKGKRSRRFFATKEDAEEFVASRQEEQRQVGSIIGNWTVLERALVAEAMRILRPVGVSVLDAAQFYLLHRTRFADPAKSSPMVGAAADELLASKKASGKRARYLLELGRTMKLIVKQWGHRPIGQISARDVENWVNAHPHWRPASRRTRLVDVRTLFAWAQARGYVVANPARMVELPKQAPEPPAIFSVEQARKILETARDTDPGLLPWLALGMFAGIRPDEIKRMVWAEVGEKYVEVTAAKAKTARRRLVAVTPALRAWLAAGKREGEGPWPVNYRKRHTRLVAAAAVDWGHDILRHSFASYHLAAHRDAARTAHELGHSNSQMLFAHYREVVTREAGQAYWKINPQP